MRDAIVILKQTIMKHGECQTDIRVTFVNTEKQIAEEETRRCSKELIVTEKYIRQIKYM